MHSVIERELKLDVGPRFRLPELPGQPPPARTFVSVYYDTPDHRLDLYPLQVLLVALAGWVNRHQQHVIEYLIEENRVLKEQVEGRRLRLTDDQRRRLAAKGRRLGRRVLRQVATIVTPDTILRWHRQLIARKWTFTPQRPGRPRTTKAIASLILPRPRRILGGATRASSLGTSGEQHSLCARHTSYRRR